MFSNKKVKQTIYSLKTSTGNWKLKILVEKHFHNNFYIFWNPLKQRLFLYFFCLTFLEFLYFVMVLFIFTKTFFCTESKLWEFPFLKNFSKIFCWVSIFNKSVNNFKFIKKSLEYENGISVISLVKKTFC